MNRDYAKKGGECQKKKQNKRRSESRAIPWLVMLSLFAAFIFGLSYLAKHKKKIHHKIETTTKIEKIEDIERKIEKKIEKKLEKQVEKQVEKVEKIEKKTEFDFYTMLPSVSESYELEVATVKEYEQADRIKAELSLLGCCVSVVKANNKYEISVGPYANKEAALSEMNRLKQNKVLSKLKKIK